MPIEPVSAIQTGLTLANAGVNLGKSASSGLRGVVKGLRLAAIADPKWIDIATDGGSNAGFTADEIRDIEQFVSSERLRPLLSLAAIGRLSTAQLEPSERQEFTDTVRKSFMDEAKRYCLHSTLKWEDRASVVWDRINAVFDATIPQKLPDLEEDIFRYAQFLSSPLTNQRSDERIKREYLRQLSILAQDIDLLTEADNTADHLAGLLRTTAKTPMITHTDVEKQADFRDLYISRKISGKGLPEASSSDEFLLSGAPYRVVLMGPPGAGKSTLVSHLVTAHLKPDHLAYATPSIILRCREYLTTGWEKSLTAFATTRINADLGSGCSEDDVKRMLILGRITVIFDGLDEISERSQRASMVQRIQVFAAQYPPVSVLVTTREVGYESAPLPVQLFTHVHLDEFTTDEVELYSSKWFAIQGREDLTATFMRESASVADLRKNPLLLSLLCILYKGNGAIPADRRGIYIKCADLFFHKWDQHRHIPQHDFIPIHADRLMQEIASKFSAPRGGQTPMEEPTIVRLVTQHLVERAAFQFEEAEQAARDFVRFCIKRAWLLRDIGPNESGIRMLEFVHQTFYEFFTAEFLAAHAGTDQEVAERILNGYTQNPTSVLPDLLIQSYDWRRTGHGSNIVQLLCDGEAPSLLLLRLVNASVLSPDAIDSAFDLILSRWLDKRYDSIAEDFLQVVGLGAIPRARFVERYLLRPDRPEFRRAFMNAWGSLPMGGPLHQSTGQHESLVGELSDFARQQRLWEPAVKRLLSEYHDELLSIPDAAIVNYLLACGLYPVLASSLWDYVMFDGVYGPRSGYIWTCLSELMRGLGPLPSNVNGPISSLHAAITSGSSMLSDFVMDKLILPIDDSKHNIEVFMSAQDSTVKMVGDVLAIVCLAAAEKDYSNIWAVQELDPYFPGRLSEVARLRYVNGANAFEHNLQPEGDPLATLDVLPSVCMRWVNGEIDFLEIFEASES